MRPWLVISGAQTGADRGGLDAALGLGIAIAGWVPANRKSEDGGIPEKYTGLVSTVETDYVTRTLRNIRSAPTTIVVRGSVYGTGTKLTIEKTREYGRRLIDVNLDDAEAVGKMIKAWRETPPVQQTVVNVAGQRESSRPGIQEATCWLLGRLWTMEGE